MFRAIKRQFSREGSKGNEKDDDHGGANQQGKSTGTVEETSSPAPTTPPRNGRKGAAKKRYWSAIDNNKMAGLATFDACVHAADALGSTSGSRSENTVLSARKDPKSGLVDCSVLVSPDGDLLLVNTQTLTSQWKKSGNRMEDISEVGEEDFTEPDEDAVSLFSQLIAQGKEDYESAIFLGNDLQKDQSLNGFSAKGWSIPATSHALYQTEHSMQHLGNFCQDILSASKSHMGSEAIKHCQRWRQTHPSVANGNGGSNNWLAGRGRAYSSDWELIDPRAADFEETSDRVGPLQSTETSSLYKAVQSVEQYYVSMTEADMQRYHKASTMADQNQLRKSFSAISQNSSTYEGFLPAYRQASEKTAQRVAARQQALTEISKRVRIMEERVEQLKSVSDRCWEHVYNAEAKCQRKVEQLLNKKSRDREKSRLEKLMKQKDGHVGVQLGTTTEEISDIAKGVAESMEEGSFEPMDLPSAPFSLPKDKTQGNDKVSVEEKDEQLASATASREQIEQEVGLPDLRSAAMKADEDIEEAAQELLTLLSTLDTTRRSARTAAEACLLAAGNAQARCLKSWIELERRSLEDRLTSLSEVEKAIDKIDIRRDLDAYIVTDKKNRGGSSHLGDDDDGGLASALATLTSHVDGVMGGSVAADPSEVNGENQERMGSEEQEVSVEKIIEAVEKVFAKTPEFQDLSSSDDVKASEVRKDFDDAVSYLCQTAKKERSSRSALCYALNAKRSNKTRMPSTVQFDGLCKIFDAILTGCQNEGKGVQYAKMCIMLAQTFYIEDPDADDKSVDSSSSNTRSGRIYIRNRLTNHPVWESNEFWDDALTQQIADALTQSGVMDNFEKQKVSTARKIRQNSEWGQVRKTKWHDLNSTERVEAASQVHAVVFAQLGALAHSMMEFGCGLERASAFVRRMSIRNNLPSTHRTMLLQHLLAAKVDSGSD